MRWDCCPRFLQCHRARFPDCFANLSLPRGELRGNPDCRLSRLVSGAHYIPLYYNQFPIRASVFVPLFPSEPVF